MQGPKKNCPIVSGEWSVKGTLSLSPISNFLSFRKMVKKREKATLPQKIYRAYLELQNTNPPQNLRRVSSKMEFWDVSLRY